jgi:glycosyltransferase involved in cell wall biosynthesis
VYSRGANGGRLYCVLAGDGPKRGELERLAAELNIQDRVRFLGRVDRPASVFAAADVIAVPSREECFGLVLVEAMATGRPVVSASVGGMREIVTPSADGLVFSSEDHAALAERVDRLLRDPALCEEIGRQARLTVCQRYSKPHVLAMIDAVLGFRDDVEVPAPKSKELQIAN